MDEALMRFGAGGRNGMSPILISVVVVLVVVFGVAIWMDLRRKHLRDTLPGGVVGRETRQLRRSDKEKGERWTAGF